MKQLFFSALALFSILETKAQVAVSVNSNPTANATLDIKNSNSTSTADGVIVPFLTKNQLANKSANTYGNDQIGTLVYITDSTSGTSGSSASQVTEINTTGFYYFAPNFKWTAVQINPDDYDLRSLYTVDDALTGNRIVDLNGHSLLFQSNMAEAFNVGTSETMPTLTVNTNNNRVGILGDGFPSIPTNFPTHKFHIATKSNLPNLPNTTNVSYGLKLNQATGNQYILTSDDNGKASWEVNVFKNSTLGNVNLNSNKESINNGKILAHTINLTKGRWYVHLGQLIKTTGAGTPTNNLNIGFSLTASPTSITSPANGVGSQFNFINGDDEIFGWIGQALFPNGTSANTISGTFYIDVIADNITLYPFISSWSANDPDNTFNPYIGIDSSIANDFDDETYFYATYIKP